VRFFYGITFEMIYLELNFIKMKIVKKISFFMLMLLFMVSFSQCSSTKQLQNNPPFEVGEVYYNQSDSGLYFFIPIKSKPNNIELDSVYFHNKSAKLVFENDSFVGNFKTEVIQKPDIIMGNEPYAEYGNKAPKLPEKLPFQLKNDECIISYKEENTTKYYKIGNIIKR